MRRERREAVPSPDLIALLKRARRGSIDIFNDQGEEGSAQWGPQSSVVNHDNDEQTHELLPLLPACLLLNDLDVGILPTEFGSHPIFASVAELDLSGVIDYTVMGCHVVCLRVIYSSCVYTVPWWARSKV